MLIRSATLSESVADLISSVIVDGKSALSLFHYLMTCPMKENKYDNAYFFSQYSQMSRSLNGLQGAGEWHELKKMLPDFKGKRVLDLGCGFGWHCRYVMEQDADSVLGIDLSEKMLAEAKRINTLPGIEYRRVAIEDFDFPGNTFDVVISSLAFHYLEDFGNICDKVHYSLSEAGTFVFSVEHPIFTAQGLQNWYYDKDGSPMHWPVDQYADEGVRKANFLGEEVTKYHKTLTTYIRSLIKSGFEITAISEPEPEKVLLERIPEMKNELRRPMFLILSAIKR